MDADSLTPERIQLESARLHALARRLAVDANGADDAVQQTWLQSLRAELPTARAVPAFLATTLRNAIAFGRRTDRRRVTRERAFGVREDGVESTADLVARLELHRHLAKLVLDLPMPQRELVLRHYFADESIDALARTHGLTNSAVRGHLHRAREQLRRRLEASDGEARSAFALLVAATARPEVPIALTAIVMNVKHILGTVVLVAVGLFLWQPFGAADAPPTESGAPARTEVAAADLDRPQTTGIDVAAPGRTKVVATDTGWIVRGEVMHGSVGPLPGGAFTAQLFLGHEAKGSPLLERTVIADAQGAFELALPEPQEPVTLGFSRNRSDTAIMASPRTFVRGDAPPQDLQVFAFVKDCPVRGLVTNEVGEPIDGAWVREGRDDPPVLCSAEGAFRIVASATYGEATIVAGAPGHVAKKQSVKVHVSTDGAELDFRLRTASALSGRVLAGDGSPIEGAKVYTAEMAGMRTRTDAEGRFELMLDPVLESHTVYAVHDDYLEGDRKLIAAQLAEPCEITLRRGSTVRGRVFDRFGRPVAGAQIRLGEWIGYLAAPRARAAADGTFEVRNVPPGLGQLSVFARGCAPACMLVDVPADGGQDEAVSVQLGLPHRIAGRIVDREGNPIHRVRVTPIAAARGGNWQPADDVYTARDGAFAIEDLPAGALALDCFGMDVARKKVDNVAVDTADLTIAMERPATIAGRVVDDATGKPVERFTIRLVAAQLQAGERAGSGYGVEWVRGIEFADGDGVWRSGTERFDEGSLFGVEASAEGYAPSVSSRVIALRDPDPKAFELRLRKAARIEGRVVDATTGAAVVGARVAVFDDEHPLLGRDPFGDPRTATTTAADGTFAIAGCGTGQLRLVARHPGHPVTFDGPFEVAAGSVATRVVAMGPGATIRGTVLDASGNAVAGATVGLRDEVLEGMRILVPSVRTDRNGRFELRRLVAMEYELFASGRGSDGEIGTWSRRIEVAANQVVELELAAAGQGAIGVEIVGDGIATDAVSVTILPTQQGDGAPLQLNATATGRAFVVRGVPEGEYQVRASGTTGEGHWFGSATVTVAGRNVTNVRVPVAPLPR